MKPNFHLPSPDIKSAEIGYWASADCPGIMTNALMALCSLAKKAGFEQLYGLTVLDNQKSRNVLIRAEFTNEGLVQKNTKSYYRFVKNFIRH